MTTNDTIDKIKNLRSKMENRLTDMVFFRILLNNEIYHFVASLAKQTEYNPTVLGDSIYHLFADNSPLVESHDLLPIYEELITKALESLNCQQIAEAFLEVTESERNDFMRWMVPEHCEENPEWFVNES